MPEWWVTLQLDPQRTMDVRVKARSAWVAGWLARRMFQDVEVLGVRPAPLVL
jgi:hypothetical protein